MGFSENQKLKFSNEATSIQLFWLLSFTMVAKKNTFSVEFLLPQKKRTRKKWCGKTRVTSHKLRVESLKAWVKIQKCDFKSINSNLQVTSSTLQVSSSNSQVKSSNPGVESSNPQVQESFNQWKLK